MEQKAERIKHNQQKFQERSAKMREAIRQVKSYDANDKQGLQHALALTSNSSHKQSEQKEYVDQSTTDYHNTHLIQSSSQLHHNNSLLNSSFDSSPFIVDSSSERMEIEESKQFQPQQQDYIQNTTIQQRSTRTPNNHSKAPKQNVVKPGWARTVAEEEFSVDAEADELINFTRELDYDTYIDDMEVREALRFVQERVKKMEAEKFANLKQEELQQRLAEEEQAAIQAGELEESFEPDRKRKTYTNK